jgi:transcriptional regulator GlxA family with amidase domain
MMGSDAGPRRRHRQVVILLLEGFSLIHMGRLAETFSLANRLRHSDDRLHSYYELRLLSARGGAVRSSSGVLIWTDAVDTRPAKHVYALFALGGPGAPHENDERLLSWLRHAHPHAQVVQGIGGGHSALEMAGLERKDGVSTDPPTGAPSPGSLSATSTAGIDSDAGVALSSALSVVKRDCGYETASQVAHDLQPTTPRQFTQSVFDSREASASDLIRNSAHLLRVNSKHRVSIADAAEAVAMSERNFLRRFKQEMGVTPTEFVLRVRLEKACHMLVDTDLPADKIARRTGLGSGDRLAKLFRQHLSMSPTEYRAIERKRLAENGAPESDPAKRIRRPLS